MAVVLAQIPIPFSRLLPIAPAPVMESAGSMIPAFELGPVICYEWLHASRARAVLCLEQRSPFRMNFIQYADDGVTIVSESGWHGMWTDAICRQTRGRTDKHPNAQNAGGHKFSLTAFHYLGYDANWFHDVELSKKAHKECWKVNGCSLALSIKPL
jgi:hypothetical protein